MYSVSMYFSPNRWRLRFLVRRKKRGRSVFPILVLKGVLYFVFCIYWIFEVEFSYLNVKEKPSDKTLVGTLRYLINGHARLFISKNLSSVSTDIHVVKYFFHPTCLFIYYIQRQGFATLCVYYILPVYSIHESILAWCVLETNSNKYDRSSKL